LRNTKLKIKSLIPSILFLGSCFLFLSSSVSAEKLVNITADHLEYLGETDIYIAKGSVQITREDTTLKADKVRFNNITADAVATGNVIYEDAEVIINADKIELNLATKLGTLYSCNIFYKKRNYHIKGIKKLKKLGETTYSMDRAYATTCDATPPEWHFKGEDIKIKMQENISARNATFYIKSVPVLYSPYFWAPLVKGRQTGFLTPSFGFSDTTGVSFKQGFFWAIKDNMDMTLYADYFSDKGLGKGLDFRYVLTPETSGEVWLYHLKDNELSRDFFEIKSYLNQKMPYDMSGYLKIHYVNEFDYYSELGSTSSNRFGLSSWKSNPFGFSSSERLQKYLESNLHISKPFTGGRTYFLGQYRQSLEGSSGDIPQSLPEAGFIINTRDMGLASFRMPVTGTNFHREDGQRGQRLDVYPNIYLSYGRTVNFTQKIGLRETLYFLENPSENSNREIFDLNSIVSTRFLKRYPSFVHIIEPSLEYVFVPDVDHSDLPAFDSIDSMPETSNIIYSFTNRLAGPFLGNSEARLRFSQSYSLLDVEKPYSPLLIESVFSSKNLKFSANAFYDVYDNNLTETIASISLNGKRGFIGMGKNFRRSTSLDQYTFRAGLKRPIEILGNSLPIDLSGRLWYDVKTSGVELVNIRSTYTRQCWALSVSYTQGPFDYEIMFALEFTGLGTVKLGKQEDFELERTFIP